jgi:peptidoglycan/LPS O-acetylase OafA/YrhL
MTSSPRRRSLWLFYALWIAVCLLSFATSTLLGCICIAIGVALRWLEVAVGMLAELLIEFRQLRLELRAVRLRTREERGGEHA